ncbi:hypothetical protein KVF93_00635 [Streptococcus equi subsp. zooepidemicus]|uniref:hypothetical protein n=1 Tax=Streptococcus equi TaxID=1336 RepID=UPI001E4A132A|nr:hypothetical protein [Streptococcus equi]MCD3410625.1 hypothetical protein [Streptococcus equi subsp. zooepidemicus]MCD3452846.1 hypothetical protein [Streptococcus equi subsp. zooepidemicus]HEL1150873.1 hypothetical protein [Streptococcus equi subsp. zooepidemicus]HEL1357040.1 hypothetical protein [Streptococcus equi subsp. zooepidemicus]
MDTKTLEAVYDALQLSLPKIISMIKAAPTTRDDGYKEGVLDGANLIADTVIKAIGQMIDSEADHD